MERNNTQIQKKYDVWIQTKYERWDNLRKKELLAFINFS